MENDITPEQARHYIDTFSKHVVPGCRYVEFGDGTTIHFDNMTDNEAIRVAKGIMDMEEEASKGAIKQ